jgi:hypothetical protein
MSHVSHGVNKSTVFISADCDSSVAWENDNRNFVNFLEVLKMVIKDDKLGEF